MTMPLKDCLFPSCRSLERGISGPLYHSMVSGTQVLSCYSTSLAMPFSSLSQGGCLSSSRLIQIPAGKEEEGTKTLTRCLLGTVPKS